jgi:cytidylate kinase
MSNKQTTVVTISRQLASGGAYIGHLLARKLGFQYVEREVLHAAAEDLGVEIRDISRQDEKKSSLIENLLKSFVFGTPEAAYIPPALRPVHDEELFAAECRIIREIVERRNVVLVGHAGFSVLAGRPKTFHVFIHAPKEFRLARLREFQSLSGDEALAAIDESDHRREDYLKSRANCDWYDARNYHLCLDASMMGFEAAADLIAGLAKKMPGA